MKTKGDVLLWFAALILGYTIGGMDRLGRAQNATAPVRFAPGAYFIEPTNGEEPHYLVEFETTWQVRFGER